MVETYFKSNHQDERLLDSLIETALEGEDCGDAPWAAANIISSFPAAMLAPHKAALQSLSLANWDYFSRPAKLALVKVNGSSD